MSYTIETFLYAAYAVTLISFVFAAWLGWWIRRRPSDNKRIAEVGALIQDGAYTFLRKEYFILAKFVAVMAILIVLFVPTPIWRGSALENVHMVAAYLAGTVFSAVAGVIGIRISTVANVKTAEAAKQGIEPSFMVGFRGGAVMGMAVVGSTLLGVALLLNLTNNTSVIISFSFGASTLALFAKAGGGIFTKTADISADLVGKVELDIPEDDPRNPAVIADNVGDNVGDVAGMGADLFDSNVASMAAALVLASVLDKNSGGIANTATVLCYASSGL
ncbi:MAG: sodium/proton-translocating pyrophosphatase, partial [Synergistaceae bacterium]|nr:sodium/proton-translocating pyrophosphatase [Synergistaceae bacterium]